MLARLLFYVAIFFGSSQALSDAPRDLEPQKGAVVHLDGKPLFSVYGNIGSFNAQDRAELIDRRLASLVKDPMFDSNSINVVENSESADVIAGDLIIVSITKSDAASEGSKLFLYASHVAEVIKSSIMEHQRVRRPRHLALHGVYALLITVGFIAVLFLLSFILKRILRLIESSRGTYIRPIKIKTLELVSAERITDAFLSVARVSRTILFLVLCYLYVPTVLSLFPWTEDWALQIYHYILDPIHSMSRKFVDFIPNFFFIAVACVGTYYTLKFLKFFFNEIDRGRIVFNGFFAEWADPTYKLVRILVLVFGFVIIFPYLPGSDSPAFQGAGVFLGLLVSFGSSSAIANIVAGVVITYMRPFKLGDRVKIADTTGDVMEKNLLITRLRTIKNVEVTIPNSMILGSHIVNYSATSATTGLILNTTVTIGYDVPWQKVQALLLSAAKETPRILSDPPPFVLQTALNDYAISYEINAYTSEPNEMALIYSDLHSQIIDEFNKGAVEILSPHYMSIRDGIKSTVITQEYGAGVTI